MGAKNRFIWEESWRDEPRKCAKRDAFSPKRRSVSMLRIRRGPGGDHGESSRVSARNNERRARVNSRTRRLFVLGEKGIDAGESQSDVLGPGSDVKSCCVVFFLRCSSSHASRSLCSCKRCSRVVRVSDSAISRSSCAAKRASSSWRECSAGAAARSVGYGDVSGTIDSAIKTGERRGTLGRSRPTQGA